MAQFPGGNANKNPPWSRPMEMQQPLVNFNPPPNQSVFQQGIIGGGSPGGPPGGPPPPPSLPGLHQSNIGYRPLGAFGGQQQLIQQQQHQAAAAAVAVGASFQQQQQQQHSDRVLVEASYNTNMPFKWNASRIQVLPNQRPSASASSINVNPTATPNSVAFTNALSQSAMNHPPQKTTQRGDMFSNGPPCPRNNPGNEHNPRMNRGPSPSNRPNRNVMDKPDHPIRGVIERERRQRDERSINRDRSRDKERARSPIVRKRSPRRSRSRSRSRSPPRRRIRTTPRYNVIVPKISLHFPGSSIIEIRKRYNNMYIPSDFFNSDHAHTRSFPMHKPLRIQSPTAFHVFNKELVEPPIVTDSVYDPPDADHSFNVKVMLMASLAPEKVYEKTCLLATDNGPQQNRDSLVHPTRAIQFLVGLRGKNETMAIGGPWCPSLDGPDPANNPSVLIKTAIRACRSLTGIDLSNCTHWYRFIDIHYRRQESSSRPARTETTVIFLPDVWSVMPTPPEYTELTSVYAEALHNKLNPEKEVIVLDKTKEPDDVEMTTASEPTEQQASETKPLTLESEDVPPTENEQSEETVANENTENEDKKTDGASRSQLDPKNMKVHDIRQELESRGLSSRGLKPQLMSRLQKDLDQEHNKEAEKKEEEATDPPAKAEDDEPKEEDPEIMEVEQQETSSKLPAVIKSKEVAKIDEKRRQSLTSAYKLPAFPCIMVHPHPKAKSGKFDCAVMSLSVLLDYRSEDNKEGTFEVSLFAELFNEMLMRDSTFKIYKTILNAPVPEKKPKEEKKESSESNEDSKDSTAVTTAAGSTGTETTQEAEKKKKMVTVDKELLLACSYFDQNHCGYIEVKDLEDILFMLDISLSRAQIKKLIHKVIVPGNKDQVNYRLLTDKLVVESIDTDMEEEDTDEEQLKTIGLGFKAFVPGFNDEAAEHASTDEGFVTYQGKVVDIDKLLSQLDRSEKARFDAESSLSDVKKKLSDLQHASEKYTTIKEKLNSEVRDFKRKLRSTEDDLKRSQTDSSKYLSTLKDIHGRVGTLITRSTENSDAPSSKEDTEVNGQTKVDSK